jgi:hypothetical protein
MNMTTIKVERAIVKGAFDAGWAAAIQLMELIENADATSIEDFKEAAFGYYEKGLKGEDNKI